MVGGITEAEAEAMGLIETVMIHFILVLIITILSLLGTTTMGTTGTIVEVISHTNRTHTRHELLTKFRQRTRDIMVRMVGWEGLAPPTATVAMGVMVEILPIPGAAIILQTPTAVVMAIVQHLARTTMRIGTGIAAVMVDTEGMARLLIILPVIHREVVL